MTESSRRDREAVLDQDTLELLGSAPARTHVPAERMANLRNKVMRRVENKEATNSSFITIRSDDGQWIEIEPLLEKKILSVNHETGIESYLLRLHPGATPDRHLHDKDELCLVLAGDVSFDDIQLEAGDFHLAHKGSWHGRASTVHGALLFLQSGVAAAQVTA